jgi:hypothetical protein
MEKPQYTKEEQEFIEKWCHPDDVKKYTEQTLYMASSRERITPLKAAILQKKAQEKLALFKKNKKHLEDLECKKA